MTWLMRTRHPLVAAGAWGIALASRANFIVLLPLAFGWLRERHGARAALEAMTMTSATILVLVVPFYLHDPAHFGPADAASQLTALDAVVPHLSAARPGPMSAHRSTSA